jgi:hypothetical protein
MARRAPIAGSARTNPAIPSDRREPFTQRELILARGRQIAGQDQHAPGEASSAPSPTARTPRKASAARAGRGGPSVTGALASLTRSSAITSGQEQLYLSIYRSALSAKAKLKGARAAELGAVLTNAAAIAAAGQFIPSRLPALFVTLDRNRQWWTTGPLLSADQHVGFPGSKLIWEYYPGQGIEIQWLATFGEANGYYLSGHDNANLAALLNEVIPLATQRAGGIAWEYLFRFDGGQPPWTSGLSQGTAIQALARAWSRLHVPAYLAAARQALGIFQTPPPQGVRVLTAAGAHYLEYSFAPSERILNGFIQALVGLYDYTSLTGDPLGAQLFEAGDAEARLEVPLYDTGAWSLYDQSRESDLSYHDLLTGFLTNLCQRTSKSLSPLPAPPSGTTGPGGSTGPGGLTGPSGSGGTVGPIATTGPGGTTGSGGTSGPGGTTGPGATGTTGPQAPNPDAIYCTTAAHFNAYLKIKPTVSLVTKQLSAPGPATLTLALSKISVVSVTIRAGARTVFAATSTLSYGSPKLSWKQPRPGTYSVTLVAVDLAGNRANTSTSIVVRAARTPTRKGSASQPPPASGPPSSGSGQTSSGSGGALAPG